MSLKAINKSYRALSARALRSTVVEHIQKYTRQMVVLAGVVGFSWQHYYRGNRQMVAMQRKELTPSYVYESVNSFRRTATICRTPK